MQMPDEATHPDARPTEIINGSRFLLAKRILRCCRYLTYIMGDRFRVRFCTARRFINFLAISVEALCYNESTGIFVLNFGCAAVGAVSQGMNADGRVRHTTTNCDSFYRSYRYGC